VVTFDPHPRLVLFPSESDLKLINTLEEKIGLLKLHGIAHVEVVPFTETFAHQPPEDYVNDLLYEKLKASTIVIGYNHRFGRDRGGDIDLLRQMAPKLGFEVIEIPKQVVDDIAVSSTKIRKAIIGGNIEIANQLLGYNFFIHGDVIKGDQLGQSLGFPTANLSITDEAKIYPGNGVYAVKVYYNKIGKRALK